MALKGKYSIPDELALEFDIVLRLNKEGDYVKARAVLRRLLNHAPDHPIFLNNVANTYYQQSDYDIAEKKYLEIIDIYPEFPLPYTNLCLLYTQTKRIEEAVLYADLAMSRGVKSPGTWRCLGIYYAGIDDYQTALEYFKTAIAIDSDYLLAYYDAGCIYLLIGEKERGYELLSVALEDIELYRLVLTDSDLDPVRDDPKLTEIIEVAGRKFEALEIKPF